MSRDDAQINAPDFLDYWGIEFAPTRDNVIEMEVMRDDCG